MTVRITDYQRPVRFVDQQTSGPFDRWRHEHLFASDPDDPNTTLMRDVIEFTAPAGAIGALGLQPDLDSVPSTAYCAS